MTILWRFCSWFSIEIVRLCKHLCPWYTLAIYQKDNSHLNIWCEIVTPTNQHSSSSYQLSHLFSMLAKNLKFIPAFAVIVEFKDELHWMYWYPKPCSGIQNFKNSFTREFNLIISFIRPSLLLTSTLNRIILKCLHLIKDYEL